VIQALILDIDGVIVGDKAGINFPDPHPAVIQALRTVREQGIPVSLCTAKPAFAIEKIISDAHLNNLHITDGGAVIVDPIDHTIAVEHSIPKTLAQEVAAYYGNAHVYQEFYTASDYYIPVGQHADLTNKHTLTLKRKPQRIEDVMQFLDDQVIVKLFLIARNDSEKIEVIQSFDEKFAASLTISWTIHPNTPPWQFGIVTAKGISKQKGAEEIARQLDITLDHVLGVGDTTHDWQFMQACGYAAAMGNASDDLKTLVGERGDKGYIGPSVNDNGIIDILRHFGLLHITNNL
jgi:HAD superfamily hydrolase (TIGR01484 family)